MTSRRSPLALLLLLLVAAWPARADDGAVQWQGWNRDLFAQAAREHRFIVLHMAAVWCHWCHVMEQTTYRDPAVTAKLKERFITVRVDQDSDPELSYRYERWGWPATIMFDSAGNEIFRRQGYLPPDLFLKLLDAVIADPSALQHTGIEGVADVPASLPPAMRTKVDAAYRAAFDPEHGGFGSPQHMLHGDTVEYAQQRARPLKRNVAADAAGYALIAHKTLDGARHLIDPVWGGMYQYAETTDWLAPHYEKLLNIQRDAIRCYVLAWLQNGRAEDLAAARDVARWMMNHMRSPDGAFFTSQDADVSHELPGKVFYGSTDAERRAGPMPRIDTSLYARENAWAVASLAALYDATGDATLLSAARASMDWILSNRRAPTQGFGHGTARDADASLGDTLAVGEAALALYRSTAERAWLTLALQVGDIVARAYRHADGGFVVRKPPADAIGVFARPVRQLDENVAAVRFLNLLWRYSAQSALRDAAEHGMRWLVAVANEGLIAPGVLIADDELAHEPAHITIVGARDDPAAQRLHDAARRYPSRYLRLEWLDRSEGSLPNPDVDYPELPQAAAFACANRACSLPVFEPAEIAAIAFRLENR